jgi:hypothetical protein
VAETSSDGARTKVCKERDERSFEHVERCGKQPINIFKDLFLMFFIQKKALWPRLRRIDLAMMFEIF